ncbi:MAG: hypothetical protein K6G60_00175 [Lachnospiraceae bacterium]|nr:hypothetical protein [Lachnospiraceae bacterium]
MAESLLAHLYSRIRGSQEDVATLSLQYIISSNEKLNEAYNCLISNAIRKDIGTDITYSCQSVGENSERPDMSGVDRNGKEIILCEMKFYAGLTANQPNGYLDRLIKEGGQALVFVCPEQRKTSLWTKVKELCVADGKEVVEGDHYNASVCGIAMTVLSWGEVVETLKRTASAVCAEMLSDIEQLSGFCNMMDSTAFIPFSPEDFGPENARREERHFRVLDRLYDLIVGNEELNADSKGLKATPSRNGYTRYLRIGDYQCALMYHRGAWLDKTSAETPYWFYLCDESWRQSEGLQKRLRAIPEYERIDIDGKMSIALHAQTDVTLDEVATEMTRQIIEYKSKYYDCK